MTKIRTGQVPAPLTRDQFRERFSGLFYDSAFEVERDAIARLEAIAWEAVQEEACNVARSVVQAVKALRAGLFSQPDKQLKWPRTK